MSQQSLPSFTEFTNVLQKIKPQYHPSEAHGMLCGHLCGRSAQGVNALWESLFPGQPKVPVVFDLLTQIQATSLLQLSEFSFDFTLILPDDEENINARAEALGLWCQGFLMGLQQSDVSLNEHFAQEAQDTLNDLAEIAKINFGEIVTNEEDEQAYFELVEYVRLSGVLIFQELKSNRVESSTVVH